MKKLISCVLFVNIPLVIGAERPLSEHSITGIRTTDIKTLDLMTGDRELDIKFNSTSGTGIKLEDKIKDSEEEGTVASIEWKNAIVNSYGGNLSILMNGTTSDSDTMPRSFSFQRVDFAEENYQMRLIFPEVQLFMKGEVLNFPKTTLQGGNIISLQPATFMELKTLSPGTTTLFMSIHPFVVGTKTYGSGSWIVTYDSIKPMLGLNSLIETVTLSPFDFIYKDQKFDLRKIFSTQKDTTLKEFLKIYTNFAFISNTEIYLNKTQISELLKELVDFIIPKGKSGSLHSAFEEYYKKTIEAIEEDDVLTRCINSMY